MTDATASKAPHLDPSRALRLGDGLSGLIQRWTAQRRQRRARRVVADLPPYLRDDIGLADECGATSRAAGWGTSWHGKRFGFAARETSKGFASAVSRVPAHST